MPFAKAPDIDCAELGVVPAAPLRDIVVERSDVEEPASLETADQLGAQRELVRELGHREAAQVPHHHEDVLVHGVDVEQIVLHLADDAAELRKVAPRMPYWFMRRNSCTMPRGCCRMWRN